MSYSQAFLQERRWENVYSSLHSVSYHEMHGVIAIPGLFDTSHVRVKFHTWDIPKNWHLAGFLNQYYRNDVVNDQLLQSWKIFINTPTVIKVNDFASEYYLKFKPLERVLSFILTIDKIDL